MRFLLALAFALILSFSRSQNLKGKIIDAETKHPVSFAIIAIDQSNRGTTADLDGNFSLDLNGTEKSITVHIVGYHKKSFLISGLDLGKTVILELQPSDIRLIEIVVTPKENPANEIIRKVIENKSRHDIRNLPYYWCNTYAKTYFTLSDKEGDESFYNKDTVANRKAKKLLDKQYLFFMESVTEKNISSGTSARKKFFHPAFQDSGARHSGLSHPSCSRSAFTATISNCLVINM